MSGRDCRSFCRKGDRVLRSSLDPIPFSARHPFLRAAVLMDTQPRNRRVLALTIGLKFPFQGSHFSGTIAPLLGRCAARPMPDMSTSPDIPRLEAAFRVLDARMSGTPGYNSVLIVVAAGFRPWRGHWLGTVIVPWAIQLVLLPGGDEGSEPPALPGERRTRRFPIGERTLMGLDLEGYGLVEAAPLLSSAHNFASQGEAESAALAALNALMLPEGTPMFEPASSESAQTEGEAITRRPLTRRDFLRGRLFGR